MSNHEALSRTTSSGTHVGLSPTADSGYTIFVNSGGATNEAGIAVLHKSGVWAVHMNKIPVVFSAETLRCIAELLDQLNSETRQEKEASTWPEKQ